MVKAIGIGLLAKRVAFRNTSDCLTYPRNIRSLLPNAVFLCDATPGATVGSTNMSGTFLFDAGPTEAVLNLGRNILENRLSHYSKVHPKTCLEFPL